MQAESQFKENNVYPRINQNKERVEAAVKGYNKNNISFAWDAPNDTLVGIEVEVEKVNKIYQGSMWSAVPDGSLRQGVEYKTPAIEPENVPYALTELGSFLLNAEHEFSEMTSVHVHIDFRNNTGVDLLKLMLVYLTFEKYLFAFAGPERGKSNFCVMGTDGNVVPHVQRLVGYYENQELSHDSLLTWGRYAFPSKYSAFNIINLWHRDRKAGQESGHGTIEFRHMKGGIDVNLISTWVKLILFMKDYAVKTDFQKIKSEVASLNTTSHYVQFAQDVFHDYWNFLIPISSDWKLLGSNLRLVKQCFLKDHEIEGPVFIKSPLAERLQKKINPSDKVSFNPVDHLKRPEIKKILAPRPDIFIDDAAAALNPRANR